MTEREQAGFRGRVESCRTERDYVYPDRHWVGSVTEVFTPEGDLLSRLHQNPDGSEGTERRVYGEDGRIREKYVLFPDFEETTFYYYDAAAGRLERAVTRTNDAERVSESVRYADDGTKTQTLYPAPLTDKQRRTTAAAGAAILHWSSDTVAIMTCFDAGGREVRKVLYDADDRVIRRIGFVYDGNGRLVEEGELIGGRIREDFRHVFRYDEAGRRVDEDMRWGDLLGERRTYKYNDRGDFAEQRIEVRDLEGSPRWWSERFRHTYDASGNWMERITEESVPEHEPHVVMIERRELTYYSLEATR